MNSPTLTDADKTINGERQDSYGTPEDSFQVIADFWNIYIKRNFKTLKIELTALDVAHLMTLLKIARMLGQKSNRDNYVDAIGYLAIASDRLIGWQKAFNSEELTKVEKAVLCKDCNEVFTIRKYSTDIICPSCKSTNCVIVGNSK